MSKINKLLGFYELRSTSLPKINWQEFDPEKSTFDSQVLWSVRCATIAGQDFNLPRLIGAKAKEAREFALEQYARSKDNGLVLYYPYFIAEKSGTLLVEERKIIIEGVTGDLWNLVTYNRREVTIIFADETIKYHGNKDLLTEKEVLELKAQALYVRAHFHKELSTEQGLLLEWSYAFKADIDAKPVGESQLLFYEIRTI